MGLIVQSWVRNRWAFWASRLALFAIQLSIVGYILHRIHIIGTPLVIGLLVFAGALAVLGGVVACVAFVQIWNNGGQGGLRSSFAIFVTVLALALPAAYLPRAANLPNINDVSTDLITPPPIVATGKAVVPRGFMAARRDGMQGNLQREGYPDLQPVIVARSVAAAFDAARTIIKREGFEIVQEDPPKNGRASGRIQAIDETLIMGFRDDFVIRVRPAGTKARIDIRSASRYGQHDFGRNANRIREISRLLRARLDFTLPASLAGGDDSSTRTDRIRKKPKKVVRRAKVRSRKQARKKRRARSRSRVRRARSQTSLRRE